MRRRGWLAATVAALCLVPVVGGCSDQEEPTQQVNQELSTTQATTLAQTRFKLGARGSFVARVRVGAADDVGHLEAIVSVDTVQHRAWGTLARGPRDLAVSSDIAFTPQAFAQQDQSSGSWAAAAWPDGTSTTLPLVFSLSSDRPENEQLLRQNGARYLGEQTVGSETLQVFALPTATGTQGTTHLLLDGKGNLKRLENSRVNLSIDVLGRPAAALPDVVAPLLPDVKSSTP